MTLSGTEQEEKRSSKLSVSVNVERRLQFVSIKQMLELLKNKVKLCEVSPAARVAKGGSPKARIWVRLQNVWGSGQSFYL